MHRSELDFMVYHDIIVHYSRFQWFESTVDNSMSKYILVHNGILWHIMVGTVL